MTSFREDAGKPTFVVDVEARFDRALKAREAYFMEETIEDDDLLTPGASTF